MSTDVTATAARHGALGLLGAVAAGAGGLALTIVVGRLLSAHDAGIYFTSVALFTIATAVLTLGSDTGLVRSLSGLRAHRRPDLLRPMLGYAVRPVLAAAAAVALIAFLFAAPIAERLFPPETAGAMATSLRVLSPFLVLSTLSVVLLNGAARGLGSLRTFTTVQQVFLPVTRPVAVAVAAVAAWRAAQPSAAVVLAWALPLVPALAVAVREVRRLLPPSTPATRADGPDDEQNGEPRTAITFWRATAPRGVAATFEIVVVWADVVLVTALLGASQGAVYAAASRFVTSGTFALQAVRLSVGPLLAAAFATADLPGAQDVYRLSVRWAILSTWPVYLAMGVFAPGVLAVLGDGFSSAAPTLTLLCLAMLAVVATGNANTVLNMAHHSHWAAANTAAAMVTMLGLDWLLVPRLGILGAALGWSAAMLVDAVAGFVEIRIGLGLRAFDAVAARSVLTVLMGFGLPALAVRLIGGALPGGRSPAVTLVGGGLIAAACYLAALGAQRRPLGLDELLAALRRRENRSLTTTGGRPA